MGGSILETKEIQRRKSSHTLVIKTSEHLPFIKNQDKIKRKIIEVVTCN